MKKTHNGDLVIKTAHFSIRDYMGAHWTWWNGPSHGNGLNGVPEHDPRSFRLVEVDFAEEVDFSLPALGDKSMLGEVKLNALRSSGCILYGVNVAAGLLEDYRLKRQHRLAKASVLEHLAQSRPGFRIDFFGNVLRGGSPSRPCRAVLRLFRGSEDWHVGFAPLNQIFNGHDLTVISKIRL